MSHTVLSVRNRALDLKPKALRRQGEIPANISIPHKDSQAIVVSAKDLQKLISQGQDTALVYLAVDGQKTEVPVLLDEMQKDGMTGQFLHVTFKKVSLKEKTIISVPLEFVNEPTINGAVVVKVLESVEVEALPTDLPEKIVVDLAILSQVGQVIALKDLALPSDSIALAAEDLDSPVVLVQEQAAEVVEEVATEITPETTATEAPTASAS